MGPRLGGTADGGRRRFLARDAEPSRSSRGEMDAWVIETLPRAVAYANSLLNDRSLADDVVHDCFCRLLRKSDEYDLKRDGTPLLFKAVTNACLNANSRHRGHLSLNAGDAREIQVQDTHTAPPIEASLNRELETQIAKGLAQLPTLQRAALELKSLGHSLQEIGEALATSPNNAGVLIHRARQAMASHLAPYLQEKPR